ncbi:MAG TPA: hypothetical protein VN811_06935 [Thermoanaerobaculia bacterium]|nr:hypothetical protein [Thermoanaerobaculia bacterium]HXT50761.1 hypothetical protein [Thermoanaerobaculia bacterium]
MRSWAVVLLAVALAAGAGCRREKPEAEQPSAPAPAPKVPALTSEGTRQVVVGLTGRDFQMDGTMSPGPVRFVIRNVGGHRHSFAVEGNGDSFRLPAPIEPGDSGTLDADLRPGSYRVFCPISGHGELPRQLVITPRAG